MGPCPAKFVQKLTAYRSQLGRQTSDAQSTTWKMYADTLNKAMSRRDGKWDVLCLPTGIGKTEALSVYCALIEELEQCGVLLVNRTIDQANKLADSINRIAEQSRALAAHSEAAQNEENQRGALILSITHAGIDQAILDNINGRSAGADVRYLDNWRHGRRRLIVIDEAFPIVRSFSLAQHDLGVLNGVLRNAIHPGLRKMDEFTAKLLTEMKRIRDCVAPDDAFLSDELMEQMSELTFSDVRADFNTITSDDLLSFSSKDLDPRSTLKACRATIETLSQMKRIGRAFTTKLGNVITISASEPSIPDALGGVILDATASKDERYKLVDGRFSVHRPKVRLRNYSNVTLWVARDQRVGKCHLTKSAGNDWPVVADAVATLRRHGGDPLICCHKDAEEIIRNADTRLGSYETAHYGNMTGKNDWRRNATVVIYGLPYLNPIVPTQACAALLTPLAGTKSGRLNDNYPDRIAISEKIIASYNVVEVTQAINRIRCRQPVDAEGGCEAADVFVLCPRGKAGENLVAQLADEMPGIVIRNWYLKLGTKKAKLPRSTEKVLRVLVSLPPGEHLSSEVREAAVVSGTSYSRFLQELSRPESDVAKAVHAYGVTYIPEYGRSAQCRFSVAA